MSTVASRLLTIEEYEKLDFDHPTELVRGRVVHLNFPMPLHGYVCAQVTYLLRSYLERNDIGRVFSNDTGVITERNPDSLRGADVMFYSYDRMPRGPVPIKRADLPPPEIVFEVLSPDDRPGRVLEKIAEYLNAGVLRVCLVDPQRRWVHVYSPDDPEQPELKLHKGDELRLPDILPGFAVPIERLFA